MREKATILLTLSISPTRPASWLLKKIMNKSAAESASQQQHRCRITDLIGLRLNSQTGCLSQ